MTVLAKFREVTAATPVSFFTTIKGKHLNIENLPADVSLEEVLVDGQKFETGSGPTDGSVSVLYLFSGTSKTVNFQPRDKLSKVFIEFERLYKELATDFTWSFKGREYDPSVDGDTELVDMSDEAQMIINVTKRSEKNFKVDLLLIKDNYEETRKFEVLTLNFVGKPTLDRVFESAKAVRPTFEACHVYKINNFDEPVKELPAKGNRDPGFDSENTSRIMVKETPGKLDFQSFKFTVYTPNNYPIDLNKQFEIKIEDDMTVERFKALILERLSEHFHDTDQSHFLFQFLNQFNVPSKYLLQPVSQLKRHCNRTNKLLVRKKDIELPKGDDFVAIFCRKRDSQQRIYEGYQQVFIPKKLQKISSQTIGALKEFLVAKLRLDCSFSTLVLTVVNYKSFEWRRLEKESITLKDGDEIGYLVRDEANAYDDLQTDELMALALNTNRENYVFNYKFVKETPFSINLGD